MRAFETITSTAGIRPPPTRGSNLWLTTPRRTPARIETDLRLLLRREELDHASDRLGGVEGVQRREDEVARLRRLQRDLGGLGVAKLTDQDDVRVLAQDSPQRLPEALGVETDLALVDDAAPIGVEHLDRVLDRHDVLAPRAVDLVEHGRERRRLAGAGRSRDEHQPALLVRESRDTSGQVQLAEARDLVRDHTERERDRASLAEPVDAKARKPLGRVGRVEVAALVEQQTTPRDGACDLVEDGFELRFPERWKLGRDELAVRAEEGRLTDLEVDVAGAGCDRAREDCIQVHGQLDHRRRGSGA